MGSNNQEQPSALDDERRAKHAAWKREWRRKNDPPPPAGYVGRGHPAPPVAERLALYIERDQETGCWNWTRTIGSNGYGQIGVGGARKKYAHVASYEELVGPIPDGLQLDHLCRNRRCINPAHLEPVTPRENTRRGLIARGKQPSTTDASQDQHSGGTPT